MGSFYSELNQLKLNRKDGSLQILNAVIDLIMKYLATDNLSVDTLKHELDSLSETFPDFAVLLHFIKAFNKTIGSRQNLQVFISEYISKWKAVDRDVSCLFLQHFKLENESVLLHSNSRTIRTLFEEMADRRISVNVFQTESLPGGEGALQAEVVRKLGFKVSVIKDDEVSNYLPKIDLFLMGADRIEPDWIVNKTGSKAIAEMFYRKEKPVYILADSRKITEGELPVKSELFEKVSRNLVTDVITEKGFM